MLKEKTLFGTVDKVEQAISFLKSFEPKEGYYLAFSGGKDSVVIKELANMAKVKYDAHYCVTTIDPPELCRFIMREHKDVIWDRPKEHFLKMLVRKGFPQRHRRWCCQEYKERGGMGRVVITGIRKAESYSRSKRSASERFFASKADECKGISSKHLINPIINWTDDDVWRFIKNRDTPYCELYDQGFRRIGCVFCPMSGKMRKVEVERYPGYVRQFIRAFQLMWEDKKKKGLTSCKRWKNGEEMFWWWISENRESENQAQGILFE